MHSKSLSRRRFLQLTAGTSVLALAACAAPGGAPAPAGGEDTPADAAPGEVHMLKWSSFVEPADDFMKEQAAAWGEANNVAVEIETINNNDIPARIAAAIQSGDGPDIIQQVDNWGHLYADSLMDVSGLAEDIDSEFGGFHEDQIAYSKVGDEWRTVPWTIVGNAHVYRVDWWEEALGRSEWGIDTWDDYMEAAAALKDAGHPFGNTYAQSFGDPVTFWYPWLWGHGGQEVNEDGSAVAINSEETIAAIERGITLNETGFVDGVSSWDDGGNNRAYLGGEISSTVNGASIYFVANRDEVMTEVDGDILMASVSDHGLHPTGPAGRFSAQQARSHGILNYSSNADSAKALLLGLTQPEFYDEWMIVSQGYNIGVLNAYNDNAVWEQDAKLLPYRDSIVEGTSRWAGWPGPPNANAFEVRNNYVVIDMFAKAISGQMTAEESAEWAAGEIGTIYGV